MKKAMCYVAEKSGYKLHECYWEVLTKAETPDSVKALIVNYVHIGRGVWSAIEDRTCLTICTESTLMKTRQKTRELAPTVAKLLKTSKSVQAAIEAAKTLDRSKCRKTEFSIFESEEEQ